MLTEAVALLILLCVMFPKRVGGPAIAELVAGYRAAIAKEKKG